MNSLDPLIRQCALFGRKLRAWGGGRKWGRGGEAGTSAIFHPFAGRNCLVCRAGIAGLAPAFSEGLQPGEGGMRGGRARERIATICLLSDGALRFSADRVARVFFFFFSFTFVVF